MKTIKNTFVRILLMAGLILPFAIAIPLVPGCTTSQQTTSYKTLYSLEHSTVAAYDAYISQVIAGKVSTNGLPKVSQAFNKFQASMVVAIDIVHNNTNAAAPPNLVVESQDLVNLINQFTKGK